jgi:hypothetical protein
MKRLIVAFVLCTAVYGLTIAGDNVAQRNLTSDQLDRIEQSLMVALESDSPNLQASAALTLMQMHAIVPSYDWSRTIIPLMHIVNCEEYEAPVRIAAARALHELRSSRGDFSITRNAQFASNPNVRRWCSMLATARRLERSDE